MIAGSEGKYVTFKSKQNEYDTNIPIVVTSGRKGEGQQLGRKEQKGSFWCK